MPKDHPAKRHKASHPPSTTPITDPRFASLQTDPRYRLPSKRHTHVRLDKRFKHMLDDEDFSRTAQVDRYGRELPKEEGKRQLERFYQFEEEKDEVDEDEEAEAKLKEGDSAERDFMREGMDSDEAQSESEEDEQEEEVDFPDQEAGAVPMGEVSSRIAVVNLDWDSIRAADLFAVFSSFTATAGKLQNVIVYRSEFGRGRIEKEETEGPPKEIFASSRQDAEDSESDDEDDDQIKKSILKEDIGEEFDSAILRRYQLERLRYYYAVLNFSSPSTAKTVYDAIDGTEYLSSANFFDLRFIPDDTDFTSDKPRDECDKIPASYKPTEFVTDALQHSKVKLTWDADDIVRKEAQAKAFRGGRKEIDENDLKAYLGSDSDPDSLDEAHEDSTTQNVPHPKKEAERQRMRSLLGFNTDPAPARKSKSKTSAPVGDMQITFVSGLSSTAPSTSVFENEAPRNESTVEAYVRKEKERRQRRKKGSKIGAIPSGDPLKEQPKDQDLGFNDPFFSATATDAKAQSTAQRKEDKRRKRAERAAEEAAAATEQAELELLMQPDQEGDIKHFDMNEIERAERKKKKGKKGKRKEEEEKGGTAQEEFEMDVRDERFGKVFEDTAFAIDPTNPRFRGTEGMKQLLEEGRRRRTDTGGDIRGQKGDKRKTDRKVKGAAERVDEVENSKDKGKNKEKSGGDDEDWKKLVEKFKGK